MKHKEPRVTIVIGIHDYPDRMFQFAKPFFTGGLKILLEKGVYYTDSYQGHYHTNTQPGYGAMNFGSTPSVHGIVDNNWVNTTIPTMPTVGAANQPGAFQFDPLNIPNGLLPATLGPISIQADSLSDTLVSSSLKNKRNLAFAVGGRIPVLAGFLGKLYTFIDTGNVLRAQTSQFAQIRGGANSSLAYFSEMPQILIDYNEESGLLNPLDHVSWPLFFQTPGGEPDYDNPAYDYVNKYAYATPNALPLIAGNLDLFPVANYYQLLPETTLNRFNLSLKVLQENLQDEDVDKIVLFIGLLVNDAQGERFTAESYESLDSVYWLDYYLKKFMKQVSQIPGLNIDEVLWVFTADSGLNPSVEQLKEIGFPAFHINLNSPVALNGTVSFNNITQSIIYTPNPGFVRGFDSFTYDIQDACGSNGQKTVITVGVGSFAANYTAYVCMNTFIDIPIFSIPGTISTGAVSNLTVSAPLYATAVVLPGNIIRFTPNNNFYGDTTFTYRFTDANGVSNTATITVIIENRPFGGGGSARTCNGNPVTIYLSEFLFNNRLDSGFLFGIGTTFVAPVTNITMVKFPDKGTVVLPTLPSADPAFVYTPFNAEEKGVDTFTFNFTDACGTTTTPATVTIALNGIPKAVNYITSTPAGQAITIPLSSIKGLQYVPPATVTFPISLQATINRAILTQYGISNIVRSLTTSNGQVYLDISKFPPTFVVPEDIINTVKEIVGSYPGVSQAWTYDELITSQTNGADFSNGPGRPNIIVNIAKMTLFPGRTGQVIYNFSNLALDPFARGAAHELWTEQNARTPLIFWQPCVTEKTTISCPVWNEQIAPTIADAMDVPRPNAGQFLPLDLPKRNKCSKRSKCNNHKR